MQQPSIDEFGPALRLWLLLVTVRDMSRKDDQAEEKDRRTEPLDSESHPRYRKRAVHERDRNTCINCRETFEELSHLDADHVVARGAGGADTIRNQTSLCRRCHEAKHGERSHAPTIRCMSTGDMIQKDFIWYRHFWNEILPALSALAVGFRVEPRFNLADDKPYQAWHIILGELRRLDTLLAESDDVRYAGMMMHEYM